MRKNAKRRSLGRRFFDACLTGVSCTALAAGDVVARNPVVAGGATAFLVTLGFVASNAIWYQPQAHDGVFFKTRPEQVFRAIVKDDEANRRLTGNVTGQNTASPEVAPVRDVTQTQAVSAPGSQPNQQHVAATLPTTTVDGGDLPALAPNGDKEVAILQYNLKQLGFYDGGVDGLTGPQTRKALEQWQSVQAKLAPQPSPVKELSVADAIAVAVPENRPQRAVPVVERMQGSNPAPIMVRTQERAPVERATVIPARNSGAVQPAATQASLTPSSQTRSSSGQIVSAEELVRIQAGLKAFGNDTVVVDGVPGKSTEDAIREFQKLFRLNVSGKPDSELIGKMREIGLIS